LMPASKVFPGKKHHNLLFFQEFMLFFVDVPSERYIV